MKRLVPTDISFIELDSATFNRDYSVFIDSRRGLNYRGFVGFDTFCDLVEFMSLSRLVHALNLCDKRGCVSFYPFHGCCITLRLR